KTVPRGTARLTPSRAALGPNRRVRPWMRMTGSGGAWPLVVMGSGLTGRLQGLVALPQQVDHFVHADVQLPGLGEQGVEAPGQDLDALAPGQPRAGVGDVSPRRAPRGDDALALQLPVGAG